MIQGHKEERKRKRRHRSSSKSGKHKKHRKRHSHSFVEIEETAPKSSNLLQLSQVDSADLTPDEGADLELKQMAKKMSSDREKGEVKDELAVDLSGGESADCDRSHDGPSGDETAHDHALRTALRAEEAEASLKKAERGPRDQSQQEAGDGYMNKASKRLMEEVDAAEDLKKIENGAESDGASSHGSRGAYPGNDHRKDHAVKKLLEESEAEATLKGGEKECESDEGTAEDGALVQVHAAPPRSISFVQLSSQVSAQAQAQAQVHA